MVMRVISESGRPHRSSPPERHEHLIIRQAMMFQDLPRRLDEASELPVKWAMGSMVGGEVGSRVRFAQRLLACATSTSIR